MNKAYLKEYALKCSETCKGGKFKRVGQDFIDEVVADVEEVIRRIDNQGKVNWPEIVPVEQGKHLLDIHDRTKLHDVFTRLVARIIQRKVERQPSCGQTLSRLR